MRETFISIVAILALSIQSVKCADINKDGFNFYKDYMRARSDEALIPEGPVPGDRIQYFYRTPLLPPPELLPALEMEYKKRTANAYKNHMLNKEGWSEGESPVKRSSKTALSMMMQNHQPLHLLEIPQYGNIDAADT